MTLLESMLAHEARRAYGCAHNGLHSPVARYSREERELRYVTVCDDCGAETREVHRESYEPNFDPAGNDPYVTVAAPA